jgi:hypothetical protein
MLESIVTGVNSRNLESLMPLYESEAAFATQPGSLAHGAPGVREALTGFISMNGKQTSRAVRRTDPSGPLATLAAELRRLLDVIAELRLGGFRVARPASDGYRECGHGGGRAQRHDRGVWPAREAATGPRHR